MALFLFLYFDFKFACKACNGCDDWTNRYKYKVTLFLALLASLLTINTCHIPFITFLILVLNYTYTCNKYVSNLDKNDFLVIEIDATFLCMCDILDLVANYSSTERKSNWKIIKNELKLYDELSVVNIHTKNCITNYKMTISIYFWHTTFWQQPNWLNCRHSVPIKYKNQKSVISLYYSILAINWY